MKRVKIKKDELMAILKQNRAEHEETFNQAIEVYRGESVDKLKKMLKVAKDGGKIEQCLGLVEPVNHLDDYDRVLQMLEMSVDDVVEIEALEFSNYVQDKWVWSNVFAAATVSYAEKLRGR